MIATLSEFARTLGVSRSAIQKAIKTGRIPAALLGSKALSSGRLVPIISDAEAARAAFHGNTNPAYRHTGVAERPLPAADDAAAIAIPPVSESRALIEFYKSKVAQLDFEQKTGKLVDAAEFGIRFSTMVVAARTRLLGVPSKAKGRIPHLTVDDIETLRQLIREALEELPTVGARIQALLDDIREKWVPLIADPCEITLSDSTTEGSFQ